MELVNGSKGTFSRAYVPGDVLYKGEATLDNYTDRKEDLTVNRLAEKIAQSKFYLRQFQTEGYNAPISR